MKRLVRPGRVEGTLLAPSSKSMAQRAIAVASLTKGESKLEISSFCDDTEAALRLAEGLGAEVFRTSTGIKISGGVRSPAAELNCGEAGLSIRMFSCLAALYDVPITLLASGSLSRRPMGMIVEALKQLGVSVVSEHHLPPLRITGPVRSGEITIDGSLSSQLLTGLLIALPVAEGNSIVNVNNLTSKPYVEMTLELMRAFGGDIECDAALSRFVIKGQQQYQPREYLVEGDWSGASCLLVAGATSGKIQISNLRSDSRQADRVIVEYLRRAGATVIEEPNAVTVLQGTLKGFSADLTECPDLFPALVALCCQCEGQSVLKGASRLTHKESDRASALVVEFTKLGAQLRKEDDALIVVGRKQLNGAQVFSHHDHRIAMALAVAGLNAAESVEIEQAHSVAKSYPQFFEDLAKVSA